MKHKLPPETRIIGYGRTQMTPDKFAAHVSSMIPRKDVRSDFLDICSYISGKYDDFGELRQELGHDLHPCNRMFYLSIPSTCYEQVIANVGDLYSSTGWNRVLIEKPIGRDLQSFIELRDRIQKYIPLSDVFCVDHYLAKPVVQSIPDVRRHYKDVWNPNNITRIDITFSERIGIEDRQYFDDFGIIRDVVQNHLLQLCAVVLSDDKKEIFRHMQPMDATKSIFGQYEEYRASSYVADHSLTPTYFEGELRVTDGLWDGIPICIRAGKAMPVDKVEAVLTLKNNNTIRIEVQPNGAIQVEDEVITYTTKNAYETVLDKAIHDGERDMFVSWGEIEQSWKVLENVLNTDIQPLPYAFGSYCTY
jgi:glucose-6-phosphate 1-dehydrogenase